MVTREAITIIFDHVTLVVMAAPPFDKLRTELRQAHHMLASRRSREYLSARMEAVAHHEARIA